MSKILGCWYVSIYIKKRGGVEGLNQKMNSDYLQAVDLEVIFSLVLFLFLPPVFSSAHISVIQWSNWSK